MTFREQIYELEAKLISQALRDANGSVSKAAKLLGFKHHQSLVSRLQKHQDLLSQRSPVHHRRKSIITRRRPVEQRQGYWEREAL